MKDISTKNKRGLMGPEHTKIVESKNISSISRLPVSSGDILIGTTANTFAKLTKGTSGQTLSIVANNIVWATGVTSINGSTGAITGIATQVGAEDLANKTIFAYKEVVTTANTSTAYTINTSTASIFNLTLTGNCTYTFPSLTTGASFTIYQKQDATGSRTVVWPASVKWPGGTAPTITSTASKADRFSFWCDGTNWIASIAGQNY